MAQGDNNSPSSSRDDESDSTNPFGVGQYGIGSQEPGGVSIGYDGQPGINIGGGFSLDLDGKPRIGGIEL